MSVAEDRAGTVPAEDRAGIAPEEDRGGIAPEDGRLSVRDRRPAPDVPHLGPTDAPPVSSPTDEPWPRTIAVVGPTATGKSAVAIAVAEALHGEVVNADAYQVYRGMDVGTAKPTLAQRARVPHHLLDILDVTQDLSVAEYQARGRRVLTGLALRGATAIVVGGSGLYVRGLLDDLRFPGSDPELRARWEARLAEEGPQALHAELAARDPAAAAHILPTNGRRIVRALEVGELTGEPFLAQLPHAGPPLVPHLSVGLDVERPQLDQRIEARVAQMFRDGLVDEVRALEAGGLRRGRTASRALGYPQVLALLDGALDEADARGEIVGATRAYARRQQRWFRRDPRTVWFDAAAPVSSTASAIADLVAEQARTLGA